LDVETSGFDESLIFYFFYNSEVVRRGGWRGGSRDASGSAYGFVDGGGGIKGSVQCVEVWVKGDEGIS
jgi:hypothetical protein